MKSIVYTQGDKNSTTLFNHVNIRDVLMDSAFNTAGALGWHELTTHDTEEAMRFYGEVFGWQFRTVKMPHGQYHLIENQGVGIGGITDNLIPALPSHWTG